MELEIAEVVAAPRDVVWDVLIDWERQPEWMLDAQDVEVLTPHRRGEGVTIRCPTNLLGVTVDDVMRVTRWRDESELAVVHLGRVITGTGAFLLRDGPGDATTVTWVEHIDPPLGVVGEWGATTFVRPVLRRVFARSLRRLAGLAEREALRRTA